MKNDERVATLLQEYEDNYNVELRKKREIEKQDEEIAKKLEYELNLKEGKSVNVKELKKEDILSQNNTTPILNNPPQYSPPFIPHLNGSVNMVTQMDYQPNNPFSEPNPYILPNGFMYNSQIQSNNMPLNPYNMVYNPQNTNNIPQNPYNVIPQSPYIIPQNSEILNNSMLNNSQIQFNNIPQNPYNDVHCQVNVTDEEIFELKKQQQEYQDELFARSIIEMEK